MARKGFKFLTSAEAGKFPCNRNNTVRNLFFDFFFFLTHFGKGDLLEQNRIIWSTSTDPGILGSPKAQQTLGRLVSKLFGAMIKTSSQV